MSVTWRPEREREREREREERGRREEAREQAIEDEGRRKDVRQRTSRGPQSVATAKEQRGRIVGSGHASVGTGGQFNHDVIGGWA